MIRPLVLTLLAILLWNARGLGHEFFPPVGQYYATVVPQPLPPVTTALPKSAAQYSAPALPYPSTVLPSSPPPAQFDTPASPPDTPVTSEPTSPEQPTEGPLGEPAEEALEESDAAEETVPPAWYYAPVYWFDLWEGNVEVGLSGSDGNSQTLNYLLGLEAKRESRSHILSFDLKYDRKTAESIETAHRLFAETRWELLFEDTAWTWFFHETTEYDEFRAFDLRLSYDTGLGRCLIKNDITSLLARAGAGTSHEIGGSNQDMIPEAVFGMEFKHRLNSRQKLSFSSEISPDVTDFLDYRLKSRAGWEVLLDEETNLSLKVSLLDRYDSTPNGKKHNDLDYTLTLLWSF